MVPPDETSAIVPGLDEGKEYEFRVVPVNQAGPGDASDPSASVFTKARRGEPNSLHVFYLLILLFSSLSNVTLMLFYYKYHVHYQN